MQQQQLAAQLAHHGSSARAPPLSPTPSDSDSDISLGAHSPPMGSPGPLRFGASSPTPLSTFRFGPHSPGPMPSQFRFGTHTPPSFRLEKTSPNSGGFRKVRESESPINVDSNNGPSYGNLRLTGDVVDTSPSQTTLQHSPPMNLRISDNLRLPPTSEGLRLPPEAPLPLRLGSTPQLTTPLRIQVTSPSKMAALPSPQTNLGMGGLPHGGIVRIAPPSPPSQPILHRPFSPQRLT